jgi:hypothetical protein
MKESAIYDVIRFLRIITILLLLVVVVARSIVHNSYIAAAIIIIITAPMEKTLESAQLDHVIIFKPTRASSFIPFFYTVISAI